MTTKVVGAANAFLATLDAASGPRCRSSFNSSQRTGWSNLPSGIFERKGLRLGDLTAAQRDAAMALMAAALSPAGYKKVNEIMDGDEVLKNAGRRAHRRPPGRRHIPPPAIAPAATCGRSAAAASGARGGGGGRGGGIQFGQDEYYLAFVGAPSATTPGFSSSAGITSRSTSRSPGASNVMTPSLPAAQPASTR